MDYTLKVDECDFDFEDDYDAYDIDHEIDLSALSSLHGDIPLPKTNEVKSNCLVDKSNDSNHIMLLSDLQNAVIGGNAEAVKNLVMKNAVYCNSILNSGWTPLTYASNFGHFVVVEVLLDFGADVNLSGPDGCTSVMAACKCTREADALAVLKVLLARGANAHLCDKNGKTLLMHAVRSGKCGVIELVLQHSNDVLDNKDNKGWTALDWAIAKTYEDVILLLIKNGANLYSVESDCISLLSNHIKESLQSLSNSLATTLDNGDNKSIKENSEDVPQEGETKNIFSNIVPTTSDENVIVINTTTEGEGYQKYGQLELLLCGLNLSHLISKFHEHDVQFEQLLCASADDLIAMGIHQVGVRNRILTAVKDWHTTEWQEASLPNFSSTALTFGNLQALLRTSSEHLLYISGALRYAKNQLKTYPQVLKPPASMQLNKNPDELVKAQVEDLVQSTHKLCRSLKSLHRETLAIECNSQNEYKQVDCIEAPKKRIRDRKWKTILITLPVLAGFAFFLTKRTLSRGGWK